MPIQDNLEALAAEIETTKTDARQAAAVFAEVKDYRDQVAGRIVDLAGQRAVIVTRRAGGDFHADDGTQLALLAADIEGLQGMLVDADAALVTAAAQQEQAACTLARAYAAFSAAEARLALAALDAHASALLGLLGDTLHQRHAAAAKLPADDRDIQATIARGVDLQQIWLAELAAARATRSTAPYGSRPVWPVPDSLRDAVTRLHLNNGRLV